jgi:hypothetical protein
MRSAALDRLTKFVQKSFKPVIDWIKTIVTINRVLVVAYFVIMAAICGAIGNNITSPLSAPLLIFIVSILGFQILAFWTYDAELGWKHVDYPWVLSATFAVITAIISIDSKFYRDQAERLAHDLTTSVPDAHRSMVIWSDVCELYMPIVNKEFSDVEEQENSGKVTVNKDYIRSVLDLRQSCNVTAAKTVLNELSQKIGNDSLKSNFYETLRRNPQPTLNNASVSNAQLSINDLERTKINLEPWSFCIFSNTSAIDYAIASEKKSQGLDSSKTSLSDPANVVSKDFTYLGVCLSVSELYNTLLRILELRKDIGIETKLPIFDWVTETPWRLRWWYLIFLFFVGLRLGKVTAEVIHARVRHKTRASTPGSS